MYLNYTVAQYCYISVYRHFCLSSIVAGQDTCLKYIYHLVNKIPRSGIAYMQIIIYVCLKPFLNQARRAFLEAGLLVRQQAVLGVRYMGNEKINICCFTS